MLKNRERIHMEDENAHLHLHSLIHKQIISLEYTPGMSLIILCVGTDRSTGDSLGPLTGTFLKKQGCFPAVVHGDINNPVHASNLDTVIDKINKEYPNNFVIAIDAGLGKKSSVGFIDVKKGPLKPGTGVNKNLSKVGDMHITGLVNVGGYMEYLVLQSTRLSLVINMAEIIALALKKSVHSLRKEKCIID